MLKAQEEMNSALFRTMARHVCIERRMPGRYLTDAAAAEDVPRSEYTQWRTDNWPENEPEHVAGALTALRTVTDRLKGLTVGQDLTYPEALELARTEIDALLAENSHNRVAMHLKISFRTLTKLMDRSSPETAGTSDPWELILKARQPIRTPRFEMPAEPAAAEGWQEPQLHADD